MRRTYRRPRNQDQGKKFNVNMNIKAPIVSLIDDDGEFKGEIEISKALAMAREAELDLVEVNPTAQPPIVRIIDFGQFKYERDKKAQKQKAHQKKSEIKGIRLSIRIGDHDLSVRREQAKKFLEKGNKIRIELIMKGREKQHPELGKQVVEKFFEDLSVQCPDFDLVIEEPLTRQGGKFTMIVTNKQS